MHKLLAILTLPWRIFFSPVIGATFRVCGVLLALFVALSLAACGSVASLPGASTPSETIPMPDRPTAGQPSLVATSPMSSLASTPPPNPASPGVGSASTSDAAAFGSARSDQGYDADGNGLFDQLKVEIAVDIAQAGDFGFAATLTGPAGALIAQGSLDPTPMRAAPQIATALEAGAHTIAIYFDGSTIRNSGADGPYQVRIDLVDRRGAVLDSAGFATGTYTHQAFQGLLARVRSLRDQGVEADAKPGYDALRITIDLDVLAAADITVQAQLFAGDTSLGDAMQSPRLEAGVHTLMLDFPSAEIAAARLNGPYTVYLTISDAHFIDNQTYTTSAYTFTEFHAN